jgi:hypothetical protein
MAKHIYDKDGNYKGKILNDEEHHNNSKYSSSITWGDLFGFMKNKDRASSDKVWYNSRWVWFWLIIIWPVGLYGLFKRYQRKK